MAIGVRHHILRGAPWVGRSRPPHDVEGRRRRDRQVQRMLLLLLLLLDDHRAWRDRALLCHLLSARTVEPAMAHAPVVDRRLVV